MSLPTITVYSKPSCPQCDWTKRGLNKHGIQYSEVDITQDADALAQIKNEGFASAPVVFAGTEKWSGFRPDKIKELAALV